MRYFRRAQTGQTLIIVALALVTLMGLVALGIDGGSALLQRRTMQNAADAAALGAIELMEGNIAVTCQPSPCHPTYADITNQQVHDRIVQLANANHGGTIGPANYPVPVIEYHMMAGSPDCRVGQACYAPAANYDSAYPPPAWTDGVRVSTRVNNPTTFARVINIQSIPVGAIAAARLFPSCNPVQGQDRPLPMLRFGPTIRDFIQTNGNSRCSPAQLWTSHPDIGGFDNLYSMGAQSFYGTGPPQLLSAFDGRYGPSPPSPPEGGLTTWQNLAQPSKQCTTSQPQYCADMRGYGVDSAGTNWTAVSDWIYWQWRGVISITQTRTVQTGLNSTATRTGDWAEVFNNGNGGNNVANPLYNLARDYGATLPVSLPVNQGGLNWGNVVTRTLYLWGPDSTPGTAINDATVAQYYCHSNQCSGYVQTNWWEDLRVSGVNGNYSVSNDRSGDPREIDRVRFTDSYKVRIYANLNGGSTPAVPPECNGSWTWSPSNSIAYALIIDSVQPPSGGTCSWRVGGGVYGRGVDPGAP